MTSTSPSAAELSQAPSTPNGPLCPAAPELLAPAGDWDCLRAAVENGADAVYFGLQGGFNARARAANFTLESLAEVMDYLHRRGVRGYVTLNTLVFSGELAEFEATVHALVAANVDAVLVQDIGAALLIRAIAPSLAIHASTQMTLTSSESIEVASQWDIERVVLARELSIDEISRIHRETKMPLEVFVHGALCVAYSGQCLTSESLGGRSANRGQCAQACRLPYELVVDGEDRDLGEQRYLLSPRDLAAYDLTPELIAAGVVSFKIEGRLKSAEYVANITRHYRRAIDAALAGAAGRFTPRDVETMELSFSRGFSRGWLEGNDHKALVPGMSSAKRGVLVGHVRGIAYGRVRVELSGSLARGDGVVFAADRAAGEEQGGRVYEIFRGKESIAERVTGGIVELAFARGGIDFGRLELGQEIWKTDEPSLTTELRKTFDGSRTRRALPLKLLVRAAVGEPLTARATLELVGNQATDPDATDPSATSHASITCQVASPEPLVAARQRPATESLLREQFNRLGATNYRLAEFAVEIVGEPMTPLSVIGKLRHALIAELDAGLDAALAPSVRAAKHDATLANVRESLFAAARETNQRTSASPFAAASALTSSAAASPVAGSAELYVLCRSLAQLDAAIASHAQHLMVDFPDIREYAAAVERAHAAGAAIWLATPRIQKPGEHGLFRALARHGADGILARNLAALDFFVREGVQTVADFSLNAANELSVAELMRLGAAWVTASFDLNREQLLDLVAATPREWLEVVLHQHMPMFHMEHCVFCAVLSPGTNKTNCGRPCDTHAVRLRDRVGMEHPLTADVGCRNTLFNATAQSAAEAAPALVERGVLRFRIELLTENTREEVAQITTLYRELVAGQRGGRDVWRALNAINRVGVTRGALEEPRHPLAIL